MTANAVLRSRVTSVSQACARKEKEHPRINNSETTANLTFVEVAKQSLKMWLIMFILVRSKLVLKKGESPPRLESVVVFSDRLIGNWVQR